MNVLRLLALSTMVLVLTACASRGTPDERRQAVQDMRGTVLDELYGLKPDVRGQLTGAAGYGVFSNANVNLLLASFGGGYGVVRDNANSRDTYMKVGELGLGLGAGVKDFRLVMVFHTRDALDRFLDYGFTFGAQADAAATANRQGGAVGGEAIADNITVYQLTQTGLALQATVKGAKFWKDNELN